MSAKRKKPAAKAARGKSAGRRRDKKQSRARGRRGGVWRGGLAALAAMSGWLRRRSLLAARLAGAAIVLALITAVWSGGYLGRWSQEARVQIVRRLGDAGFRIERITLRGREMAARDEILDALGVAVGEPIFAVDMTAARRRVEALGWVQSAAVARLWPDTLHISVIERSPAAVWQKDGALRLIDREGVVIAAVDASDYVELPLLVGAGADAAAGELFAMRAARPALFSRVAAAIRVAGRRWDLRLDSGARIMLPEEGAGGALAALVDMHESYGVLDRNLVYIDLRNADQIVFKPADAPSFIARKD